MSTATLKPRIAFDLPRHLEACAPPETTGLARDQVRLLVSYRDRDTLHHARFTDLPAFLQPGDLVVVNSSATLPAALEARLQDGSSIALHLSTRLPAGLWVVEPRRTIAQPGQVLTLPGWGQATLLSRYPGSSRLWVARLDLPEAWLDYVSRWGRPIAYDYACGSWDLSYYQTIFAQDPGSAEMPSAGRAFTPAVVDALVARGVSLARLTLHTGVASLERDESPYEEYYEVPAATAQSVNAARAAGGRIIAVGTTVVRALESAADIQGAVGAAKGWTDLVVTPERGLSVVDALLTGFHEPRATHLLMLEAFAGRERLAAAYRAALANEYHWHEFGDLHLILPRS